MRVDSAEAAAQQLERWPSQPTLTSSSSIDLTRGYASTIFPGYAQVQPSSDTFCCDYRIPGSWSYIPQELPIQADECDAWARKSEQVEVLAMAPESPHGARAEGDGRSGLCRQLWKKKVQTSDMGSGAYI